MIRIISSIVGQYRLTVVAIMALWLVGGCASREHLGPDYGVKTRGFFEKQRVYAVAAGGNPRGVDSEEASLIHGNYRKDMGGTGKVEPKESASKVLIVQENKGNAGK